MKKSKVNYMLNGGGGLLELPYRIRLFHRVKIRMGCRDPVLFSFPKRFYVLE